MAYVKVVNGNGDVFVTTPGGKERRLTDDPADDMLPRFTPDGRSVLFASKRTGNWQIYEVPFRGGPVRRVRSNSFTEFQIDLSPDGKQLAFLSNASGQEGLWLMAWPDGPARQLVDHGRAILGNPDWSPDGKRIVFSSNYRLGHQIYLVDSATGKVDRLSPIRQGGCEPRWSPDGSKVLYVSRGHMRTTSRLVAHDVATHEEKVLIDWPALNYGPVLSHDGSEIAFSSTVSGVAQVYRQRLRDGKSWQMTFGKEGGGGPDYRRPGPRGSAEGDGAGKIGEPGTGGGTMRIGAGVDVAGSVPSTNASMTTPGAPGKPRRP